METSVIIGICVGVFIIVVVVVVVAYCLYKKQKCLCGVENLKPTDPNENYQKGDLWLEKLRFDYPRTIGLLPENQKKNIVVSVLPYDDNRVMLGEGRNSDYINASYITKTLIAAQDTKLNHEFDFYRMVWEHQVKHVINLSKRIERRLDRGRLFNDDKTRLGTSWEYGDPKFPEKYSVKVMGCKSFSNQHSNLLWTLEITKGIVTRTLKFYEVNTWPTLSGNSPQMDALYLVRQVRQKVNDLEEKIVVQSGNGSGRVSVFIGLWVLIERNNSEELNGHDFVTELRKKRDMMIYSLYHYNTIIACHQELRKASSADYSYD